MKEKLSLKEAQKKVVISLKRGKKMIRKEREKQVKSKEKNLANGKEFRSRFWGEERNKKIGVYDRKYGGNPDKCKGNQHIKPRRWERGLFILMITLIFGVLLIILLAAMQTSAQSSDNSTLQEELNSLTNELSNSGFSWLINYTLNESEKPKIEVYR